MSGRSVSYEAVVLTVPRALSKAHLRLRVAMKLAALVLAIDCNAAHAQTDAWTWVAGENTIPVATCKYDSFGNNCAAPGVYGTLGAPAPGNIPGGRQSMGGWTDSSGNEWIFGGDGTDSAGVSGYLNDLWEFNPSTREWAWMSGDSTLLNGSRAGVYGSMGTPAPGNVPSGREESVTWIDGSGNLWLFGGYGTDVVGTSNGFLNDLWVFKPSTREWTWEAGSSVIGTGIGQPGTYGTLGVAAAGNLPGSRCEAVSWTDAGGNFWLFGGYGLDADSTLTSLNDLWEFKPATGEWAWIGGSNITGSALGVPGVYGILGTPAAGNVPGTRGDSATWVDLDGNFWLFGGQGIDSVGVSGFLNDLWKFNLSSREWTWMAGSNTVGPSADPPGVYGTLGTPAPGNTPGGRLGSASWTDLSGNLWLFGGEGIASGGYLSLNDLWDFSPSANDWTWMGGNNTASSNCYVGAGGTAEFCGWPGVYGTLGAATIANIPGARSGAVSWTDASGDFWLFGGGGFDGVGNGGFLNDVWKFGLSILAPPPAATPTFSPPAGTYPSALSVTISDSTPGATIYYSINATPTTSSTQYTGAISVTSSETIEAIAVATGYSTSAVGSAAYVIGPPPTFTLSASPSSVRASSGGEATTTLTITPENGFNSAVSFTCSGLAVGASCSFSPATVTPSGRAVAAIMTIHAQTLSAAVQQAPRGLFSGAALALAVCFFGWRRRRGMRFVLLAVGFAGLGLISGCGPDVYVMQQISSVTVTATSGSIQQTATVTLRVD